jgi:type I restriction enzyme, R subunit
LRGSKSARFDRDLVEGSGITVKEKTSKDQQVIETALANPKDKFKIGIRKLIEKFMIQRLEENGKIVTRYVEDQEFQNVAFDGLADEIFYSVLAGQQQV